MIRTKKDLVFYLSTDLMMNRGRYRNNPTQIIKEFIMPDTIMNYLRVLRKLEYCINSHGNRISRVILIRRLNKLGMQLGFTIPCNVFGYGLVVPHYGTIVVGGGNHIGNYAVLHTSTCITAGEKSIGDGLYVSTGAKLLNDINLGNNITVSANSLVNKTVNGSNLLIVGMPAQIKTNKAAWYYSDRIYEERWMKCEQLKNEMYSE